jgi:hypothetical protein
VEQEEKEEDDDEQNEEEDEEEEDEDEEEDESEEQGEQEEGNVSRVHAPNDLPAQDGAERERDSQHVQQHTPRRRYHHRTVQLHPRLPTRDGRHRVEEGAAAGQARAH